MLYSLKNKSKKSLSCVRLFATPWTVAYQAPPSMGFSRQGYWNGLLFPSPGIFLTQGSNLGLPHCRQMLYHLGHREASLSFTLMFTLSLIWPQEPLQASFYVTLTCPHHSLGTFLFSGEDVLMLTFFFSYFSLESVISFMNAYFKKQL